MGNFYGRSFSGIDFDSMTLEDLHGSFEKFLPIDSPGKNGELLSPKYMQQQFLKAGLETKHPSIYSMICWMIEVNEEAGIEGLTFDDFLN